VADASSIYTGGIAVRVTIHTWFGVSYWITLVAATIIILKLSR
jgi:hypothetical protein